MWINKHQEIKWVYAEKKSLMNVEFRRAVEEIDKDEAPFVVVDIREA